MLVDFSVMTAREGNLLWFLFPDPRHRARALEWEREAVRFLALFRARSQRSIGDPWLTAFIHDLEQASPAFREWLPRQQIQGVQTDHKHLIHPLVGRLVLQARTFQVADHPDVQMIVYTPVCGTGTAAKLALLSPSPKPSNHP